MTKVKYKKYKLVQGLVSNFIIVFNLVRKSPVAEKTRSASTDVGRITRKSLCRFSRSLVFFLPEIKESYFLGERIGLCHMALLAFDESGKLIC